MYVLGIAYDVVEILLFIHMEFAGCLMRHLQMLKYGSNKFCKHSFTFYLRELTSERSHMII